MKINYIGSIIFAILLFPSLCLAARDVSQIHLEPGDGAWSLGMGVRFATFPYVGVEEESNYFPPIIYSGEKFFIDGTRVGFHLLNSEDWLISTYAAYRFGGFNEEDSSELDGMDRNDGVDGRLAVTRRTDFGRFTLDLGADISNTSEGWDVQVRWGEVFKKGNFRYRPWIGFGYEDQDLTNYYFGVNDDETTPDRAAYVADSASEWSYGLDLSYLLGQHHYLGMNIEYSGLDTTKINSPIVEEGGVFQGFFSYRYEFNDFADDPNVSGNLFKGLKQGEWYWRAAAGRFTDTTFNNLMRFDGIFDPEPNKTGIASLFVGKKITDRFASLPIEVYVTAGYVRHNEKDQQSDFNEYVLGFKLYFSKFPWSHIVKTRVGLAEGISYAAKVPTFEKESIESKNRSASHLLNYLDWSWDFSLGDIIRKPSLKDCYIGWSVHHRSGIFSGADLFGNVDGGSNINTLYLQCHNNTQ